MADDPNGPSATARVKPGIFPNAFAALETLAFKKPWRAEDFSAEAHYCGWLLGEPSLPLGYLFMQIVANEAELLRIATHPQHRRQGLARKLWDGFLTDPTQKDVTQIFLEVSSENTGAQNLYNTLGFRESGRRPAYYGPGEDAVLMHWQRDNNR